MSTQLVFIVVALAALAAESGGSFADSSGDAYCRLSPYHQLCLKSKPCPAAASDKYHAIDEAGIKAIVDTHNELRSRVARGLAKGFNNTLLPSASNMKRVYWDPELAEIAQRHANKCQFAHDCWRCRMAKNGRFWYVGQNIFGAGLWSIDDQPLDFGGAVRSWYAELTKFKNHDRIDRYAWDYSTAHATQVIWAHSPHVGCGYVVFKGAVYKYWKLIICNYGVGANTAPAPIYKRGIPCSQCEHGTTCDKDFLCAMQPSNGN